MKYTKTDGKYNHKQQWRPPPIISGWPDCECPRGKESSKGHMVPEDGAHTKQHIPPSENLEYK